MKYKFLIVSKTSFFNVHGRGWVFFKGVSSLSLVCLAGNLDSLEDDDAGSDDILLDSESDGIKISSSDTGTHSSSILASLLRNWSSNPSLASFIIFIISVVSNPIFCQGEIYEPWNNRLFSFLPLLKNNSNQEHINSMDTDPLNDERILELV